MSFKYMIKNHLYEMIYFFLIYIFSLFPMFLLFLNLPDKVEHRNLIMACVLMSSIPASLYTEYSFRKLGFVKHKAQGIFTYIALTSVFLLLVNLDYKLFGNILNLSAASSLFICIVISFTYLNSEDCSLSK